MPTLRARLKRTMLGAAYPGWRRPGGTEDGYTLSIAVPMDMPFLAYLALKGLREVDLRRCREILVAPDGCGAESDEGVARAIAASGLKEARLVPVSRRQRASIALFGEDPGLAHWTTIVESIDCARTGWIFLHDTDAFFLDPRLVEANYDYARAQELDTLGVTARWDPDFKRLGVRLPGTWELMFSTEWARRWRPVDHKSAPRRTPLGSNFFDTMLYPQYCDYPRGKVQVRESGAFLHLSGTVTTYRNYVGLRHRRLGDEMFRLLFLSLLKEASPDFRTPSFLPPVDELAVGLGDASRPLHYAFPNSAWHYSEFRAFMTRLLEAPVLGAARDAIVTKLKPFDAHFAGMDPEQTFVAPSGTREHCLWLG